jgi:hypothetical protein
MKTVEEQIQWLAHRALVLITQSADGTGEALSGNESFRVALRELVESQRQLAYSEALEAAAAIVDSTADTLVKFSGLEPHQVATDGISYLIRKLKHSPVSSVEQKVLKRVFDILENEPETIEFIQNSWSPVI